MRQAARSSGISAAKASRIKAEMIAAEQLTYYTSREMSSAYRPRLQPAICGSALGDRQGPEPSWEGGAGMGRWQRQ